MLADGIMEMLLPETLFARGLACASGADGVEVDFIQAHVWFNLAALGGDEAAVGYRAEIADEMTRAQVSEAQRRARDLLRAHDFLARPRGAC